MGFIYYNQNDYPNVPYPSPTLPDATVKSGGCGVCCAAMVVSSMGSETVDPKAMAAYAIAKGARVSGGTDMNALAKAACIDYGLVYEITSDENKLLKHLQSGGMAIANVGGDRQGYTGVFSNSGHYIVAAACSGDVVQIMDPGYYKGKFSTAGRKDKVTVDGNYCYCNITVLASDTANRSPAYWLFTKEEAKVEKKDNIPDDYAKEAVEWAVKTGLLKGNAEGNYMLHDNVTRQNLLLFLYRFAQLSK